MTDARALVKALGGRWCGGYGIAKCPAHADREPSLKIKDDPRKNDRLDVICFGGCGWREVKSELRRQGLIGGYGRLARHCEGTKGPNADRSHEDEYSADRQRLALRLWGDAKPLPGTLGERYFRETRGLDLTGLDLHHAIRWNQGVGAIIGLMTDPRSGVPTGAHRTFVDLHGNKIERRMLARQGVIRLNHDADVVEGLGIAEGIESSLAFMLSGWRPVWAMPSASALASFPPQPGVEALTIYHDKDEGGLRAAEVCAEAWAEGGKEVFLA
jgi:putative DNA primase/helicase